MSEIDVTQTSQTVNVNQAPSSIRAVSKTQRIVVSRGGEKLNRVGTTQQIVVNRGASSVEVVSTPQRLVVNSPGSSVGVVNAGPVGPTGPMGPADLSVYLTVDGQLLTRASGDLAPITRPNLAADPAFTAAYATSIAGHVALPDPHAQYLKESDVIDEDNMASNLSTKVPTQQSVKAFAIAYFASTTARDAALTGPSAPVVGQAARCGVIGGTGTTAPRDYVYSGSVWMVTGWWHPTGRIGCALNSASRAIGAGATDIPTYTVESYDYDGGHATNATGFTVQIAGVYGITVQDILSTSSGGVVSTAIAVNGGNVISSDGPAPFGLKTVSANVPLAVGQVISSATYSANALSHTSYLNIHWERL